MSCKQFEVQNLKYVGAVVVFKQNAWEPHIMIKWISNTFIMTYKHINILFITLYMVSSHLTPLHIFVEGKFYLIAKNRTKKYDMLGMTL
jgi:hypothetical protein